MQDPIFKKYNVDAAKFWADMEADREKCSKIAYRVNKDTYYVNYFIKCAHNGTLHGLNNAALLEAGREQKFYPGVEALLKTIKETFKDDAEYAEYEASISIDDGSVLSGNLPAAKLKLVQAWVEIHREDLLANWKLAVNGESIFKISPLR